MLTNTNNKDKNEHVLLTDESDLYKYWQFFCHHHQFSPENHLRGIDHGQLNLHDGPDFQGAEFELNGKIYRGDVEIHQRTSEWYHHGHHLDNNYDRVMLHLVWQDSPQPVFNSKKQSIPSISIKSLYIQTTLPACYISTIQINIDAILQNLALQRLLLKSKEFNREVENLGVDQALYKMLLKSLGNTQNKQNYQRIADLIPWKKVNEYKQKKIMGLEFWQALYWGVAGLINRADDQNVMNQWKDIYPLIKGKILKKEQWKYGGLRPNNFPKKRLNGLAHLIFQLKEDSLYKCISQVFFDRKECSVLLNSLFTHFTPKIINKSKYPQLLWGRSLVLEIIGNVFIPCLYYHAQQTNSYGFVYYLQQFFLSLPTPAHYGRLKSLDKRIRNNLSSKRFFYYNQALLHLQNNYCYLYKCRTCPLKTKQQKN